MKDTEKKDKQKSENPMKGYNPTERDFEFTEQEIDEVNKSEKEEIERKHRMEQENKPNKK